MGDKNSNKESSNAYSYDADYRSNLWTRFNLNEFNLYYAQAKKLLKIVNKYSNIVNVETIDFDQTLKDDYLFSDKSVTTYTYFSYHGKDGMFNLQCNDSMQEGVKSISKSRVKNITYFLDIFEILIYRVFI
ncbi:MAG: hypothetical protein ACR5LD_03675 [Symbiopectobacterium sp.]